MTTTETGRRFSYEPKTPLLRLLTPVFISFANSPRGRPVPQCRPNQNSMAGPNAFNMSRFQCMVPLDPGPRHNVPPLGYARLPAFHICLFPALSQIPCKYHAIQHHLQRLRLHQPAFTPIHPPQVHRGGGGQTMTMPRGEGEERRWSTSIYIIYSSLLAILCRDPRTSDSMRVSRACVQTPRYFLIAPGP